MCACVFVCVCMCVYAYASKCARVHMFVCMHVWVCAWVCECVYVCVCVCVSENERAGSYGVATMSGLLKIICLFYKRAL